MGVYHGCRESEFRVKRLLVADQSSSSLHFLHRFDRGLLQNINSRIDVHRYLTRDRLLESLLLHGRLGLVEFDLAVRYIVETVVGTSESIDEYSLFAMEQTVPR